MNKRERERIFVFEYLPFQLLRSLTCENREKEKKKREERGGPTAQ